MAKVEINVPSYRPDKGLQAEWDEGFLLEVSIQGSTTVVRGNREGLRSLARQILTLTQDNVPVGAHWHFDNFGALEEGSTELIVALANLQ